MSEPLFRRVGAPARVKGRKKVGGYRYVPVEPCEHGNIDPHITFINEHGSVTVLKQECPGAGIGGDDE